MRVKKKSREIYEVESILNKRYFKGKALYLIKWKGFNSSENSWEPEENIESVTPGLIAEFESDFEYSDENDENNNISGKNFT